MSGPTLLVLAAGMGSRYGGLKQIEPVGPSGEAIIDYSIHDALVSGFSKVVFVIRKDIEEAFVEFLGDRWTGRIDIELAFQELDDLPKGYAKPADRKKPWGTGHAIWVARNQVETPFLVINGDDFYGRGSFALASNKLKSAKDGQRADYCMVGYRLANTLSENGTVSRGICATDHQGNLESVTEYTRIGRDDGGQLAHREGGQQQVFSGDELTSMNMFGFTPSVFHHLERELCSFLGMRGHEAKSELYIPSVVSTLIKGGMANVEVLDTNEQWFGVTYREDLDAVKAQLLELIGQGVYPSAL
jgi:dTDP-glucose pyrophosphorylase